MPPDTSIKPVLIKPIRLQDSLTCFSPSDYKHIVGVAVSWDNYNKIYPKQKAISDSFEKSLNRTTLLLDSCNTINSNNVAKVDQLNSKLTNYQKATIPVIGGTALIFFLLGLLF